MMKAGYWSGALSAFPFRFQISSLRTKPHRARRQLRARACERCTAEPRAEAVRALVLRAPGR